MIIEYYEPETDYSDEPQGFEITPDYEELSVVNVIINARRKKFVREHTEFFNKIGENNDNNT